MVKHLRNPARVLLIEQATADLNCGAFGQPENAGSVGKPFPLDGTFIYGYVLQESKTTVCVTPGWCHMVQISMSSPRSSDLVV